MKVEIDRSWRVELVKKEQCTQKLPERVGFSKRQRRLAYLSFEGLLKIRQVVKPTFEPNLGDTQLGGGQKLASMVDFEVIKVFDVRFFCPFFEVATKSRHRQMGDISDGFERNFLLKMGQSKF